MRGRAGMVMPFHGVQAAITAAAARRTEAMAYSSIR